MPTVFVSYAHSTPERGEQIAHLIDFLRRNGLVVVVDTDVKTPQGPPEGWSIWMKKCLRDSNWVLIVCDSLYRLRFDAREDFGVGLGSTWEGAIITRILYRQSAKNDKFIPLIYDSESTGDIPDELSDATHYAIPSQLNKLTAALLASDALSPSSLSPLAVQQPRQHRQRRGLKVRAMLFCVLLALVGVPLAWNAFKLRYVFQPTVRLTHSTNWLPPELPVGCTNVVVSFGGLTMHVPLVVAQISGEQTGTKFLIRDLPERFLEGLEQMTNYSPRNRNLWLRRQSMEYTIGGRKIEFPIAPQVLSNRLYIEALLPFSRERRVLLMRDELDERLPRLWDRNYNSNSFEVVNEEKRPVLQVVYKAANEVQVNGIFHVQKYDILESFGAMPLLISPVIVVTNSQGIEELDVEEFLGKYTNFNLSLDTNAMYGLPFTDQKAIFRYPSNRHLGELAD